MARILPLILLAACTDGRGITETGNPEMSVALTARSTAPESVSVGPAEAAPIAIDGAWAFVEDVKLVQGTECDVPGELETDAPSPGAIDLAEEAAAVVEFQAPAEDYCRVRVRTDQAEDLPDGAPPELLGNALVVTGTRTDGAPFVIVSAEGFDADVRSRSEPFTLDEARDSLVLALDAAAWFQGWSIDDATPEGDGVVRIDAGDPLLASFEAAVEASMELFEDEDDDDVLDDTEDDSALATSAP